MKKLLTLLALATLAGSASAAAIDWKINMGRNGKVTDSEGNPTSGPVYLIFADAAADLADAASNGTFSDTLSSLALDSVALTSAGKWDGNDDRTATDSKRLTAGETYDFAVVVYDSANDSYYVSATSSQQAYDENAENVVKKGITLGVTDIGSTYSGANWADTVPSGTPGVPEPATGALALAGVALLFKRRRA